MKVLVTGGAGFCGSHLVDRLIAEGHQVVVVDNLSTGFERNINSQARFFKMDIRDQNLEEIFKREGIEIVNHHAAQMDVRRSTREPMYDADVNILGSLNLMQLAVKYGIKKFIYISSGGAVYGEPEYLPVNEGHKINPGCQYGISKHTVEHYLTLYQAHYGLNFTVLRYPNVYGPRQNPYGEAGVVAIFGMQMLAGIQPTIFGDGTKTRDYVYISDVVAANILAMGDKGDGRIYNLGWEKEVSDLEVFTAVRDALGKTTEPQFGEKRLGEIDRICLDSTKARQELGWQPKVPFAEGIKSTMEFLLSSWREGGSEPHL